MHPRALLFAAAVVSLAPVAAFKTYAATAFGADPTGKASSTVAIRSALAAITVAGGGTLYFSPGTYYSAPFNLTSNSVLLLDRALLASVVKNSSQFGEFALIPPLPSYGEGRDKLPNDLNGRYEAFIGAYYVSNVTITTNSTGIIHGRGYVSWSTFVACFRW
jgi:polygalacturonase